MTPEITCRLLSVYLVEDNDLLASRIIEALQDEPGVRFIGRSADAQEAIAAIAELEPDLAIVDLSLREGTGFDILRTASRSPSIPQWIVLTNHSSPAYKRAAEQLGVSADHFFDKTEQLASFVQLVHKLADRRLASAKTGEPSDGREHEQANRSRSRQGPGRARHA